MRDDLEFCLSFIQEVERNPSLYDHHLPSYSNRRETELIWKRIGAKFNESGSDCKAKWKSIRSSYTRSLNTKYKSGSGTWPKKEYYLAQYLKFLNPYTKSRAQDGNIDEIQSNTQIIDESIKFENSNHGISEDDFLLQPGTSDMDEDQPKESREYNIPIGSPSPRFHDLEPNALDKYAMEYLTTKKQRTENKIDTPQKDPCEMFLLSLVPYMKSMTQREQLTFQKGVLNLIEEIKYPESPQTELNQ